MKKIVLDLHDRRPVWSMPDWVVPEIERALPEGWELQVIDTASDGSGDGVARVTPELLEAIEGARVYCGYGIPAEVLEKGTELRWVHSGAAGVGGSLTPAMLASDVVFTNSKGLHGPPMGETVLGMILYFARGLDGAVRGMAENSWDAGPFYADDSPMVELSECTVGVLGFGGVGQEIAARVAPLGARVLGYKRSGLGEWDTWIEPAEPAVEPENPRKLEEGEIPAYRVTNLSGPDGLATLLAESDFLVVCAPATSQTRGIIDRDNIARMKDGAVLINVARGSLVDEPALVQALWSGKLRGAALDVVADEPLPEDSPLWELPNVLITPHVSAVTRGYWRRQVQLIVWNLQRLEEGRGLLNEVDKQAGY